MNLKVYVLGDIRRVIADAFEVFIDLDGREDLTQVGSFEVMGVEDALAGPIDLQFQSINFGVLVPNMLSQDDIALKDGIDGVGQEFVDPVEHLGQRIEDRLYFIGYRSNVRHRYFRSQVGFGRNDSRVIPNKVHPANRLYFNKM